MVSRIAQSGVIWRQSSWRRGLPGDPGQKWCRSEPEWQEGEAEEDRGKGISWRGGGGAAPSLGLERRETEGRMSLD